MKTYTALEVEAMLQDAFEDGISVGRQYWDLYYGPTEALAKTMWPDSDTYERWSQNQ